MSEIGQAHDRETIAPLDDDVGNKRVLDMIVLLIAATGYPPKACDVVRALGIPDASKTIVYMSIESLRRKGFLAKKEDAEKMGPWGKQNNLVPLRQSNAEEYKFRAWPVARKAEKRPRHLREAKAEIQTKFTLKTRPQ